MSEKSEGESLKDAAHSLLIAHRAALVRRAQRVLLRVLLRSGFASADDVRAVVDVPQSLSPTAFGAVPGELAKAGIIAANGYVKTTRKEGHGRPVTVWRLVDASKALHWLAANPDLPDVEHPEADRRQMNLPFNKQTDPAK
ncbi:MAG: hypothetical protein HQ518_08160 [Rhodopirellula sp.]|nr:hypothetical protein [Rhodopirellula sp.]